MGWSCTKAAGDVEAAWSDGCRKATGSSNVFVLGAKTYFYECDGKEYASGAISGVVFEMLGGREGGSCVEIGKYRIDGKGNVKRAPACLLRSIGGA